MDDVSDHSPRPGSPHKRPHDQLAPATDHPPDPGPGSGPDSKKPKLDPASNASPAFQSVGSAGSVGAVGTPPVVGTGTGAGTGAGTGTAQIGSTSAVPVADINDPSKRINSVHPVNSTSLAPTAPMASTIIATGLTKSGEVPKPAA